MYFRGMATAMTPWDGYLAATVPAPKPPAP